MADAREFVPPMFAAPCPPLYEEMFVVFIFVQEKRATENEYVEKRIIIQDVYGCMLSSVARGAGVILKLINMTERNVLPVLRLTTGYSSAGGYREWKAEGGRQAMKHEGGMTGGVVLMGTGHWP